MLKTSLNTNVLCSDASLFYNYYNEADELKVCSLLCDFIVNYLDHADEVKHLQIFCDSIEEQNKNCTMFSITHFILPT